MTTTRAIAYIRVSTNQQADQGHSLLAQQEKVNAYASLYDLDIVDYVIETGSAKNLNREGLQGALAQIKSGQADALIVVKLDRLTRSVVDLGYLVETYFNKAGLLSVSEQIDTRSASGRLVLNVLASVSQWEREAIGERTVAVKQSMKANGLYCGGIVPYGQMLVSGELVNNPNEQAIINRAKTLKAEGHSLRAIATMFSNEGLKTRKDTDFSHVLVSRMAA
jgi:DNA invertase Pin-like site-specific DNA recombinase